jgi:hypothetical protein
MMKHLIILFMCEIDIQINVGKLWYRICHISHIAIHAAQVSRFI